MKPGVPLCCYCTHFHRASGGYRCDAFPQGIPTDITTSLITHGHEIDGDHGIRFEENPEHPVPDWRRNDLVHLS